MFWTLVLASDLELSRTVEGEHRASSTRATEVGVPHVLSGVCGRSPYTLGKVLHWAAWPPSPPPVFYVKTFQMYPCKEH